jgi:hypothetical protein
VGETEQDNERKKDENGCAARCVEMRRKRGVRGHCETGINEDRKW